MPAFTEPLRIWSYCDAERLRARLRAEGCEVVKGSEAGRPEVREATRTGLKVMFLPAYEVRAERRNGETDDQVRTRICAAVRACEADQDAREQAAAQSRADNGLSGVLSHAIKVLWVLQRQNRSDEAFMTLELRRPSPRERRLFADASGAVSEYEAAEVMEAQDGQARYRVLLRMR